MRVSLTLVLLIACLMPGSAGARQELYGPTVTQAAFRQALLQAGIPGSRLPTLGGSHYALVRRAEVDDLVGVARHRLSRDLGSQWDRRFNCLAFAWNLVNEASKELAREQWHDPLPAESGPVAVRPAVLAVSYVRSGGQGAHAVNLILTDQGPVWFDPQSGPLELQPGELATVFYPNS